MKDESSWAERFYTHFLGRDLAYLFAGGLFVCIVEYALDITVDLSMINFPKGLYLDSIGFLLGSYFLGLALSEFSDTVRLINKQPDLPTGYSNLLLLYEELVANFKSTVINRNERTIFLMHVGASVGVSAFWGAVLMGVTAFIFKKQNVTTVYWELMISLVIFGIYMIYDSRKKTRQIEKEWCVLASHIESKKQIEKSRGNPP